MKKYTLRITYLILLFAITTAISMETHNQLQEYLGNFIELPLDLKQAVQLSILQNAIIFLSQRPINLPKKCTLSPIIAIDNNNLMVRENDNQINTWNLMTGQLKQTVQASIDEDYIQVNWQFKNIGIKKWDSDTHEYKLTFSINEPDRITAVTTNKNKVAIGLFDGTIHIRDLNTGNITHIFQANNTINTIALCNDIMLTASPKPCFGSNVQMWNLKTQDSKTVETSIFVMDAALYNDKAIIL